MSASKMDHKELQRRLKEDEIAHFFQEMRDGFSHTYQEYGRQLTLIVALVVVVAIGAYFWRMNSANNFQASQQLYSNAVAYVQQNEHSNALTELNTLLKDYSGSKVAVMARVLRADCYAQAGNYDLALTDYQSAVNQLSAEDALVVRFAIVQTLRSLDRADDALRELDAVAKQAKSPVVNEQVQYLQGCCYEDKNETDKALEAFKSVPVKSRWYSLAIEKIQWLEAQPVAPINAK